MNVNDHIVDSNTPYRSTDDDIASPCLIIVVLQICHMRIVRCITWIAERGLLAVPSR